MDFITWLIQSGYTQQQADRISYLARQAYDEDDEDADEVLDAQRLEMAWEDR